ncbi:MAG TPA: T9SS type A sorting domain-containing protein [Bacteroidales bacterium]|nr:T9SS type A sorting domain-containing protein [Bacteroidales bacterium]
MPSKLRFLIASVLLLTSVTKAQSPFTQHPQNFAAVYLGAAIWADYDLDGHMDFYVTGWRSQGGSTSAPSSYLYRNNGNGTFTETANSIIPLGASTAAWGDFNNDGYPDLVVTGNTGASAYDSRIYRNNGNGTFTDIQAGLTPLLTPAAAWGDLNNDGRLDLIISGTNEAGQAFSAIYYNNGNETFTAQTEYLPQLTQSAVAIADMNLDGYNDIIICGRLGSSNYISTLYLNNGNGGFTQSFSFEPARYPSIDISDFDADGLPDVIIQGGNNTDVLHTTLYKNLGGGSFQQIAAPFTGVYQGCVAFGDYNNDGLSDVAITGSDISTGATRITRLYTNNGNSTFSELTTAGFPGLRRSMVQWGDANNDGKLDLLMTGYFNVSDYMTRIYTNNAAIANTPPTSPQSLQADVSGNNVVLSWLSGSDAQTPTASLTYNLRVGTTPGGSQVLSAHALANGTLTMPRNGNQGFRLSSLLKNLPDGTYYWSVQSVDAGFMGSAFAAEQSFTVGAPLLYTLSFVANWNNLPLQNVKIELPDGYVLTDATGQATFQLDAGVYPWFATLHGFRQQYGSVQLSGHQQVELNFEALQPAALPFIESFTLPQQPSDWHNISENNTFVRWNFPGNTANAGSNGTSGPVHAALYSPEIPCQSLAGQLRIAVKHRLNISGTGTQARIRYFSNTSSLPTIVELAVFQQSTGQAGNFVDTSFLLTMPVDLNSIRLLFELEETTASTALWEIDEVSVTHIPPTALHENATKRFDVYVNHANQTLHLANTGQSGWAKVYNMAGRLMVQFRLKENDNHISISSLLPGVYIIKLENGDAGRFVVAY